LTKYNGVHQKQSSRWAEAFTPIQAKTPVPFASINQLTFLTVLPYFYNSPFFDGTSNNATLMIQAMNNQNLFFLVQTRSAFEERLQTMQGLEFIVSHDPSEGDTKFDHSGVWVIRKQNRRKRAGLPDEITGISSYYVVGENIYMAPSVGSIIGSRTVSQVWIRYLNGF